MEKDHIADPGWCGDCGTHYDKCVSITFEPNPISGLSAKCRNCSTNQRSDNVWNSAKNVEKLSRASTITPTQLKYMADLILLL